MGVEAKQWLGAEPSSHWPQPFAKANTPDLREGWGAGESVYEPSRFHSSSGDPSQSPYSSLWETEHTRDWPDVYDSRTLTWNLGSNQPGKPSHGLHSGPRWAGVAQCLPASFQSQPYLLSHPCCLWLPACQMQVVVADSCKLWTNSLCLFSFGSSFHIANRESGHQLQVVMKDTLLSGGTPRMPFPALSLPKVTILSMPWAMFVYFCNFCMNRIIQWALFVGTDFCSTSCLYCQWCVWQYFYSYSLWYTSILCDFTT